MCTRHAFIASCSITTGLQQWQEQPDQHPGLSARPTGLATVPQGQTLPRSFHPCNLLLPVASCHGEGKRKRQRRQQQQPDCSGSKAALHQSAAQYHEIRSTRHKGREGRRANQQRNLGREPQVVKNKGPFPSETTHGTHHSTHLTTDFQPLLPMG